MEKLDVQSKPQHGLQKKLDGNGAPAAPHPLALGFCTFRSGQTWQLGAGTYEGKTERLERWRYRYIFLLRFPILGSLTDEIRDDDKDMTSQQANINIMNKPCVERAEIQRFLKHYICMGGPYSMGFLLC